VLVVDVDTLEAVNLLDGVDQVRLRELFAEDGEQVVQVEWAIDEGLAGLYVVAFLNVDVHAAGDGVFLGGLAILAFDVDFAHALGDIAIADDAVDFADDGGDPWVCGSRKVRQRAGEPPVMSLVLVVSRGIFASTSPAWTSSPSLTIKWAREGMRYFLRTLPEESRTRIAG